jgi:error-prone DNA polymerase
MGFDSQHDRSWSQLQQQMVGRVVDPLAEADGGDAPGFSRKRPAYDPE